MYLFKAKGRVSSKVSEISEKEYLYLSFILFLDFNYSQDLVVDADHFSNMLKYISYTKELYLHSISMLRACKP